LLLPEGAHVKGKMDPSFRWDDGEAGAKVMAWIAAFAGMTVRRVRGWWPGSRPSPGWRWSQLASAGRRARQTQDGSQLSLGWRWGGARV